MKKTIFFTLTVILPLLSGCTAVMQATGRYSLTTKCELVDSPTNRAALVESITSVGNRHGFRDHTARQRESMARFSRGEKDKVEIIYFMLTNGDDQATGFQLAVCKSEGKLIASLRQLKTGMKRTRSYEVIRDSLVAEIRSRFGESASFHDADLFLL